MADIAVTPIDVRPLPGCDVERYNAGGAGNVGDLVYMAADGDVEVTDADAAGTTYGIGIVVSVGGTSKTAFVAGDRVDVAVRGRVAGFSGMTPGDVLYTSNTAGKLADAAGTTSHKVARARSAAVISVQPAITEA
jgi:hypothetical protein